MSNEHLIFPTRAERELSVDELRKHVSYDPDTGTLTWLDRPWIAPNINARYRNTAAGTPHRNGGLQIQITYSTGRALFQVHRIAWALMTGEWPDHRVDHENNDAADNTWTNLRLATSGQNSCNRASVDGAVPFKGVYLIKRSGKFAAQIKFEKVWEWLGLHPTAEAAARAYDTRAIQLHGEFARTNQSMGLL